MTPNPGPKRAHRVLKRAVRGWHVAKDAPSGPRVTVSAGSPRTAQRPGGSRPALAGVGVGFVLLIAVIAAGVSTPWDLSDPQSNFENRPVGPPIPPRTFVGTAPRPAPEPSTPFESNWLAEAAALLAACTALVVGRHLLRRPGTALSGPDDCDEAPAEMTPEDAAIQGGLSTARRLLSESADPRQAIVAAWLALEYAAATSGLQRDRWQTPTEFAVAVLDGTGADFGAVDALLRLYHRARFSDTPLSQRDLDVAVGCLDRLTKAQGLVFSTAETGAI